MTPPKRFMPWISIVAAAVSASAGLYAATMVVRNMDEFMSDLDKQSQWAAIAAAAAGVSVLAQAIED